MPPRRPGCRGVGGQRPTAHLHPPPPLHRMRMGKQRAVPERAYARSCLQRRPLQHCVGSRRISKWPPHGYCCLARPCIPLRAGRPASKLPSRLRATQPARACPHVCGIPVVPLRRPGCRDVGGQRPINQSHSLLYLPFPFSHTLPQLAHRVLRTLAVQCALETAARGTVYLPPMRSIGGRRAGCVVRGGGRSSAFSPIE